MAACHLIAGLNFSLLCDIYANNFVYARIELIAVLSCECFNINNNTVFTVRYLHRSVTNFASLLAEDCTEESFLRCKLGFALRCNLTYKNIARTDLGTYTDNTVLVKVFKSVIADIRNISCDFLGTELCITSLNLVLYNVDRGIYIVANDFFINKNSVLVVVTLPSHKADESVFTE